MSNYEEEYKGYMISLDGEEGDWYPGAIRISDGYDPFGYIGCYANKKDALDDARLSVDAQLQPCGHPVSAIVSSDEGTSYCKLCEEENKK